jgi:membrane-associated phospholipid phosphatase
VSRGEPSGAAGGIAAIGATAVGFGLLAWLVTTGSLSGADQYAVDHWMADFQPSSGASSTSLVHEFYPHLGSPLEAFCNLWTFPASPVVSGVVVACCCAAFVRRGVPAAGLAWGGAWLAGNLVEVIGKHVLQRPALHALVGGMRVSFDSFGHSFPSGHALRAVITAAVLATIWKRAALPALVWTLIALPALVVAAAHTPSDVVGGVLVALVAVLSVRALLRQPVVAA